MHVCYWFEEDSFRGALGALGPDNIMFETDFPHPTCLYPNPVERAADLLVDVSDDTVRKVMQDNAAKLYNIQLPVTV
jgi:predicted TIM-barrel fold metal-dependent hydrolase